MDNCFKNVFLIPMTFHLTLSRPLLRGVYQFPTENPSNKSRTDPLSKIVSMEMMEKKQCVYRPLFTAQTSLVKSLAVYKTGETSRITIPDVVVSSHKNDRIGDIEMVRKLPDFKTPEDHFPPSEYIQRYISNKESRHHDELQNYQQKSEAAQNEIYDQVETICGRLIASAETIQTQIDQISRDIDESVQYERLDEIHQAFGGLFDEKRILMDKYYGELKECEGRRLELMVGLTGETRENLIKIAHLMPDQVENILDGESLIFNYSIVANRRKYIDLIKRLRARDIREEFILREKWTMVKLNLQNNHMERAIQKFIDELEGMSFDIYELFGEDLHRYMGQFDAVTCKIMEIFGKLRLVRFEEIEGHLRRASGDLAQLDAEYENLTTAVMNQMTALKQGLIAQMRERKRAFMASLTEIFEVDEKDSRIEELVAQFMDILKKKTNLITAEISFITKKIRSHHKNTSRKVQSNYDFISKGVILWNDNERTLNSSFDELNEKILSNISENKIYLENIENNISRHIEDIRQGWTEAQLNENFDLAVKCLENLKISYEEFTKSQVLFLNDYPNKIDDILEGIRKSMEKYFSAAARSKTLQKAETPKSPKRTILQKLETCLSISDDYFHQVNKTVEETFEGKFSDWRKEINDKSREIVEFKTEEVEHELQIKMNLLKPRQTRIEIDIYRFRIAELHSHYEVVNRYCGEIRGKLREMDNQMNLLEESQLSQINELFEQVERLESVLDNTFHISKYNKVRKYYEREMDACGGSIKTSFRTFRTTLERLARESREKTFELVQSFRPICEGGSYSAGEMAQYRLQVQKVSQEIDSAEHHILENLEVSESKRMNQYTKICSECQQLLAEHVKDVHFLSEIGNILTKCQIKIKSEAAKSNGKARNLHNFLQDMKRATKSHETLDQVKEGMAAILAEFRERAVDLTCLKNMAFMVENQYQIPIEVAPKNTRKYSVQSRSARVEERQNRPNHGYSDGRNTNEGVLPPLKEGGDARNRDVQNETASKSSELASIYTKALTKREKLKIRVKQFESPPAGPPNLIFRNKVVLHLTIGQLQARIEAFFKMKSGRPKSRILAEGNENSEESTSSVVARLEGFMQQIMAYQKSCVNEFGDQVLKLTQYLIEFVTANFEQITGEYLDKMKFQRDEYLRSAKNISDRFSSHKNSYNSKLFPILGHPAQKDKLAHLLEVEKASQSQIFADLEVFAKEIKKIYAATTVEFIVTFLSVTAFYGKTCEGMLVEEDVLFDEPPLQKKPIEALLYRREPPERENSNVTLVDTESYSSKKEVAQENLRETLRKIRNIRKNKGEETEILKMFESEQSGGGNPVQRTVRQIKCQIAERTHIMEEFLDEVTTDTAELSADKSKWMLYWSTCVEKIKNLYEPNK